jgi:hypothetical protein
MDIYNSSKKTPQEVYDSFNFLVFNNDVRVIFKMIKKITLYNKIKNLNGDIFEFGVFKGASIALWLQLIKMNEFNSLTSVVGFDYFSSNEILSSLDGENQKLMTDVIKRAENEDDLNIDTIYNKCNNILPNRLKLIKGDASKTCISFKKENPGARIKLLYLDLDLDEPTYNVLVNLWNLVVKDGIVVLDEYGFHKWDESNGVDRFLKTIEGQYTLTNTNIQGPTLVITKNVL